MAPLSQLRLSGTSRDQQSCSASVRLRKCFDVQRVGNYTFELARPELLLVPPFTFGALRETLAIGESISTEQASRLWRGIHPVTMERLLARQYQYRVAAFDVGTYVPKSISILLAAGDLRVIALLVSVNRLVVAALEERLAVRVRQGGANHSVVTGEGIGFGILEFLSRMRDPHLHIHNYFLSLTRGADGKYYAASPDFYFDFHGFIAALFLSLLATGMRALGYEVIPTVDGFEVAGISHRLIRQFSRASNAIKKTKAAGVAQNAPLTRAETENYWSSIKPAKGPSPVFATEQARWLEEMGDERDGVLRTVENARSNAGKIFVTPEQARDTAAARYRVECDRLFGCRSVWRREDIEEAVLRSGYGDFDWHDVREIGPALQQTRQLLGGTTGRLTTSAAVASSRRIVEFVRHGRNRSRPFSVRKTGVPELDALLACRDRAALLTQGDPALDRAFLTDLTTALRRDRTKVVAIDTVDGGGLPDGWRAVCAAAEVVIVAGKAIVRRALEELLSFAVQLEKRLIFCCDRTLPGLFGELRRDAAIALFRPPPPLEERAVRRPDGATHQRLSALVKAGALAEAVLLSADRGLFTELAPGELLLSIAQRVAVATGKRRQVLAIVPQRDVAAANRLIRAEAQRRQPALRALLVPAWMPVEIVGKLRPGDCQLGDWLFFEEGIRGVRRGDVVEVTGTAADAVEIVKPGGRARVLGEDDLAAAELYRSQVVDVRAGDQLRLPLATNIAGRGQLVGGVVVRIKKTHAHCLELEGGGYLPFADCFFEWAHALPQRKAPLSPRFQEVIVAFAADDLLHRHLARLLRFARYRHFLCSEREALCKQLRGEKRSGVRKAVSVEKNDFLLHQLRLAEEASREFTERETSERLPGE
ncbi:MAG: relaxase domain-containing protein [Verrucomicrobiota bacterium]|nr:relaxase domain-containing protein [Verrucomicrobiota bacterium]